MDTMNKLAKLREPMPMPDPSFPLKIHQCRTNESGSTLFTHHWHEHMEFLYFVSGTAMIECGSSPFQTQAGDLIVVNSNELHYGVSHSTDLFYYAIIVDIAMLQSYAVDAVETKFITPITQNRILFLNQITHDENITACILALIRELENKELGYELSIKSQLYRLLSLLIRSYVAPATDLDQYRAKLRELERLAPVFKQIDESYSDKLTVEQLANLTGLSRYHFSRLFKQLTDKSLMEYINWIRINKSEELLRNTSMSISEIAEACGFNDIYYFSRTFRKHKELSPTKWRSLYL